MKEGWPYTYPSNVGNGEKAIDDFRCFGGRSVIEVWAVLSKTSIWVNLACTFRAHMPQFQLMTMAWGKEPGQSGL